MVGSIYKIINKHLRMEQILEDLMSGNKIRDIFEKYENQGSLNLYRHVRNILTQINQIFAVEIDPDYFKTKGNLLDETDLIDPK